MTDQAPQTPAPEEQPKPVRGEALDGEEGTDVVAQQNVGPGNREGGGEWPDPNAEPRGPAPGAVDDEPPAG